MLVVWQRENYNSPVWILRALGDINPRVCKDKFDATLSRTQPCANAHTIASASTVSCLQTQRTTFYLNTTKLTNRYMTDLQKVGRVYSR